MFLDGFSEGQTRDINEGFPPESFPYTDHYDYLSDSDLEDSFEEEEEDSAEDGEQELPRSAQNSHSEAPLAAASGNPPWPPSDVNEVGNNIMSVLNSNNRFVFR